MNNDVALVVVYNHRFDRNIEIVEKIHSKNFSNIYHLMPFYDGDKENVIPVYEHSYYFQGYLAQGYKSYFKKTYKHYFFVADDMILNPVINEDNYKEHFDLDDETGFIPYLASIPRPNWPHNRDSFIYNPYRLGIEVKNILPSVEEGQKVLDRLKIKNGRYTIKDTYFFNNVYIARNIAAQTLRYFSDRFTLKAKHEKARYPLIESYSDIVIVPAVTMKNFVKYCGAFAATDLFVELAIPTALAFSTEKIKTESDLKLQGRALWKREDYAILDKYERKLKKLLKEFPENYIYLHAIKLSQWDTTLD